MLARRTWILLVVVLLIFGFGIGELFVLRFSRGDIYPPYSSLRADPLGSKALYDALSGLDGIVVTRNQAPLEFLQEKSRSTILYLGVSARYFSSDGELLTLGKLAAAGHRVIIGLLPADEIPTPDTKTDKKPETKDKKKPKADLTPEIIPSTEDLWKLKLIKLPQNANKNGTMNALDQTLSYHSGLGFDTQRTPWKTLGSVHKTPVIIERTFGLGSLVLLADSYPLSNEALRKEQRSVLLTTLLGGGGEIIFDETHFGVREQPGVASLARRYRLHGVVAVTLLLAALFLWRNLTPLFPRSKDDSTREIILCGQTAHAGLISLLRRSVAPRELPLVALAEWEKSAPPSVSADLKAHASSIAGDLKEPPMSRLTQIHTLLNSKKHAKRTT